MQARSNSCEIDRGLHKFATDWTCKSSSIAAVKCGCNIWFNFKKRTQICIQSKQILPVLLVFDVIDNYSNRLGYDNRNMKVKSLTFMHHFCGIQREEDALSVFTFLKNIVSEISDICVLGLAEFKWRKIEFS